MRAPPTDPSRRPGLSPADRERLGRRYPGPRIPRPVLVAVVGAVALVGLAWLLWTASIKSRPAVSASVAAFTVVSDTRIDATVTVDRPDPSVPVVCRILAQATDFQPVGEISLRVKASAYEVVDVPVSITTLRKATTATVRECSPS